MWKTRWISGPAPVIAISTSAMVRALVGGDQQPEARGVDEADAAEVEHELARVVGQDAVEHRLQREGGGHVEVAAEGELDAVLAARTRRS